MIKDRLKPCPFCGGHATITKYSSWGVWYQAYCTKCYVSQRGATHKTRAEAVEAWNRRADEKEDA